MEIFIGLALLAGLIAIGGTYALGVWPRRKPIQCKSPDHIDEHVEPTRTLQVDVDVSGLPRFRDVVSTQQEILPSTEPPKSALAKRRSRKKTGEFQGDDSSTGAVNEAWKSGVKPKSVRKPRTPKQPKQPK